MFGGSFFNWGNWGNWSDWVNWVDWGGGFVN